MELTFLGCGSAYYPQLGNTAAYFQQGDTFFLLDCGETVFRELRSRNLLEGVKRAVILITHFHADHCGSLPTLVSYLYGRVGAQVSVFHPARERLLAFLDLAGASRQSYALLGGEGPAVWGAVRATPYRVTHAGEMPCYGYVLECEGERVFYSGDAARVPPAVLERFLRGEIGRMYVDCCLNPSKDHGGLAVHCAEIPPEARGRVFCMHLSPADREAIRREGFRLVTREES